MAEESAEVDEGPIIGAKSEKKSQIPDNIGKATTVEKLSPKPNLESRLNEGLSKAVPKLGAKSSTSEGPPSDPQETSTKGQEVIGGEVIDGSGRFQEKSEIDRVRERGEKLAESDGLATVILEARSMDSEEEKTALIAGWAQRIAFKTHGREPVTEQSRERVREEILHLSAMARNIIAGSRV